VILVQPPGCPLLNRDVGRVKLKTLRTPTQTNWCAFIVVQDCPLPLLLKSVVGDDVYVGRLEKKAVTLIASYTHNDDFVIFFSSD